jgi:hypothetical protein
MSGVNQHTAPGKLPKRPKGNTAADAAVPYIVTLGGGPAKDGGAILLRFKLSDGREIVAALKVGSVGMLVCALLRVGAHGQVPAAVAHEHVDRLIDMVRR